MGARGRARIRITVRIDAPDIGLLQNVLLKASHHEVFTVDKGSRSGQNVEQPEFRLADFSGQFDAGIKWHLLCAYQTYTATEEGKNIRAGWRYASWR